MANLGENLTAQMQELVEKGVALAIHAKNPQTFPLHLLWALVADSGSLLNQVFNKMNVSKDAVELEVKSKAAQLPTSSNVSKENVQISKELINSLESAKALMVSLGDSYIAVDTWIISALELPEIKQILGKFTAAFAISLPIVYRLMASHQKDRIDAFLHPENTSLPGNYHVLQSKIAIGSGGITGKGRFAGTQKELGFVPVQKSDFIYSVLVEEMGLIAGAIVIILYTVFLFRICNIAWNAKDEQGSLIAVGFIGMFAFQIFENIAMTMGIMPVTGITLPFLSYGGSSIVANMIALGLILNVGIRSKTINF